MKKGRRTKGVLERAAEGDGIICPKCKTLAAKSRGNVYRCPVCRQDLVKENIRR